MTRELVKDWGGIDILVNNAAINRGDNFATTTDRAWDEIIDTNVNSLFAVTKPIYKQMIRQRKGAILNITSIGAIRALPTAVHYATSKAAMIGFTKCLVARGGKLRRRRQRHRRGHLRHGTRARASRTPHRDAQVLGRRRAHGSARRAGGVRRLHGQRPEQLHERRDRDRRRRRCDLNLMACDRVETECHYQVFCFQQIR